MKYGFSQKIIFLLKSMYDRVVSAVKVKSGLTASFTHLVGVRRGCNLSPTLLNQLNIFVNDIVNIFDSTCDPLIMGPMIKGSHFLSTFFKQRSTEGEGEGVRGSVKLKALVRWRLAKNVVQLELTNSV